MSGSPSSELSLMQPKIVIACDSFKGSLGSRDVGAAAARGVRSAVPDADIRVVAVADGGEGTVAAVVSGIGGEIVRCDVTGPLGNRVAACYGRCGDMAVLEMAQSSGLTLVPSDARNPWLATSYGTGEMIRHALAAGCRKFLVGLGGSATNDGGAGMLQALGFRLLDVDGNEIGPGGGELLRLDRIDDSCVTAQLQEATFSVACDVTNPLTGDSGASRVFGPQKGADLEMTVKLDEALRNFAAKSADFLGHDLSTEPGAGAAGGMGFAFTAFLGGKLQRGVDMVLDAIGFNETVSGAMLIITGEGCLDRQTCMGKTPYGVLQRGLSKSIPVVAIGGSVKDDAVADLKLAGFSRIEQVMPLGMSLDEAMQPAVAAANVENSVYRLVAEFMSRGC